MVEKWGWLLNHTLDSKKYTLNESGQVTSATLKNTGELLLHIYGFGIEFEWQKAAELWWTKKSDIFLKPGQEAELPVVKFSIPINIEPKTYVYKVGILTESFEIEPEEEAFGGKWKDHGIVLGEKDHEIEITRHPDRDYQVFLSHSNHREDKGMIKTFSTLLSNNGIKCFIAEETKKYGRNLWQKIRSGIISSNRVLILWTKHGARSDDVREELGITIGARKPFIPIIEKKVKPKGSLIGTEYIPIDRDNYKGVFVDLTKDLIKFSEEKAKRKKELRPAEEIPF